MGRHNGFLVVGISGVTCGGKTSLAKKLANLFVGAKVLHQDKYFLPDDSPRHIPVPGLNHNNYDILSALDMEQMYTDTRAVLEGGEEASERASGEPRAGMLRLRNKRLLIIEGFTVLNYKPLYELCDLRYYFVLEYGECFARRVHRLYDPPDVEGYFDACVWPCHLRYRAELENDPRVTILEGTRPNAMDVVIHDLRRYGVQDITEEELNESRKHTRR